MSEKEAASELPPERVAPPAEPPPPPADWRKLIEEWIARRFGRRGLIVLAGIFALVAGWWNWNLIEQRPGVRSLFSWVSRPAPAPLPQADPRTLSIAVAHLENDDASEFEGLIVEALREFRGVQILQFDRWITVSAGTAGDAQHPGHESARELLKKAGTDVLIWGKVIRYENSRIPKLYWTTAHGSRSGRYALTTEASLPESAWKDLTALLGLQIRTAQSDFLLQLGRYNAAELKSSIERARPVLAREAHRWDAITRAWTEVAFADSLILYGTQSGENPPLEEAVQILNRNLTVFESEPDKTLLAATTALLGSALLQLGEREAGTERLKQAVEHLRVALSIPTRHKDVRLGMRGTLGAALLRLGERESGTTYLKQAEELLRLATQGVSSDKSQGVRADIELVLWVQDRVNLGAVLVRLGGREPDPAKYEEAAKVLREVLREPIRERFPIWWAMAQMNLGAALFGLSEYDLPAATTRLEEAIIAFRGALEENTRERVPLQWAQAKQNLALSHWQLGRRKAGTEHYHEAIAAYREVLQVVTPERDWNTWAKVQVNLAGAMLLLGARESNPAPISEALDALDPLLQKATRQETPLAWAQAQALRGLALTELSKFETGTARINEAIAAYGVALGVFTRKDLPVQWGAFQCFLGRALVLLGERESNKARFEEAIIRCRRALQVLDRARAPTAWADAQHVLGKALAALGEREHRRGTLDQATKSFRAAKEVFESARLVDEIKEVDQDLQRTLAAR